MLRDFDGESRIVTMLRHPAVRSISCVTATAVALPWFRLSHSTPLLQRNPAIWNSDLGQASSATLAAAHCGWAGTRTPWSRTGPSWATATRSAWYPQVGIHTDSDSASVFPIHFHGLFLVFAAYSKSADPVSGK